MKSFSAWVALVCSLGIVGCSGDSRSFDPGLTTTDAGPRDDGGMAATCQTSADCKGVGAAVCDLTHHVCVQCLTDGQCPTSEVCKHDMLCHGTLPCRKDDDCSVAFKCGSEGTCVVNPGRCMTPNDCLDPAKKQCETESLTCVACLTSLDCGSDGLATCTSAHTCQLNEGRCRENADCAGQASTPVCDTTSHYCVACSQDSQCDSRQCLDHECAPLGQCSQDAHCVNVSGMPRCDPSAHQCVACLSNPDCPNNGVCSDHTCRAAGSCSSDNDCTSVSGRPRCVSNQCVACTSRPDCGGNYCVNNVCQAADYCTMNTDCSSLSATPYCNTTAHKCVQCTANNQCGSGYHCGSSNTCEFFCSSDFDCSGMASRTHCATGTGSCVQCTSNSHCSSEETCTNNTCQTTSTGTSCYEILVCVSDCTAQSCAQGCYAAGSPTGQSYYEALISCLFDVACPDMTTNGICNRNSSTYNSTNCQNCINSAAASGGTCGSAYDDCEFN